MIEKEVQDDILNAPEKWIAEQNNCITVKAHGLAKTLAEAYPWCNVYAQRPRQPNCKRNRTIEPSVPGTITVSSSPTNDKHVIHMFAQYCPANDKKYNTIYNVPLDYDTSEQREQWFKECLSKMEQQFTNELIAVPFRIGCGLAGGNWDTYRKMLEDSSLRFIIYKLQ